MRNFVALVLSSFFLFACEDDGPSQVSVRVENSNDFAYDSVLVISPSNEHQYGAIPANSRSAYQQYEQMYSYAYINVKYDDKEYILQPIDYVGEKPLAGGFYTFLLALDTTQGGYGGLSFSLIKD